MSRGWTVCALVTLVGCADEMGDPAFVSFSADPASGPAGSTVRFAVELDNFVLSGDEDHDHGDHDHGAGDGNTGHVHVYFDAYDTNPIAMMTTPEAEGVIPADAEVGMHVIFARLHGADHLVVEPEVATEIEFEVLP